MKEKLIIDLRLYNQFTGIGLVSKKMYQFIPRDIYDVIVIAKSEIDFKYKEDDIIFLNGIIGLVNEIKLYYLFKKLKPKFVVFPHYFVSLFIPKGIQIISFVHDVMAITHRIFFWNRQIVLKSFILKTYLKFVLNRAVLIVPSNSVKNDVFKLFAKRAILIPNGSLYSRKAKNNSEDAFLYIGNNRKHKNLSLLIKVFAENDFKILIISSVKELNSCNITVKNNLSEDDLISEYRKSKCLIIPSFCEGFGIPIIDSLKLGTPVLVSKINVFKEFYGLNIGYFVPHEKEELIFNLERSEIKTSNIFSVAIDNFSFFDWGELKYFLENLR